MKIFMYCLLLFGAVVECVGAWKTLKLFFFEGEFIKG